MIPTYEQLEAELRPFKVEAKDNKGNSFQYLSIEKKNEYLASKGVVKLVDNDVIVLQAPDGSFPYKVYIDRIGALQSKKKYEKIGQMGTNKVNDIKADEIDF